MDEEKKSVILYTEWAQPLKALSLEDKGRIFDAILSYSETGETPHFDSNAAPMTPTNIPSPYDAAPEADLSAPLDDDETLPF